MDDCSSWPAGHRRALPRESCEAADRHIRSGRIPGYVTAVHDGHDLVIRSRGSKAPGQPMDEDVRFPLGCLSKLLISLTALRLSIEDLISLDEPIEPFFGRGSCTPGITIRHILTHSAGYRETIPRRWDTTFDEVSNGPRGTPFFAAGTAFSYTQSGAALIVPVLEKATGLPIACLLNRYICEEAGIRRFPEHMVPTPDTRDCTLHVYHDRLQRLMPFRLPKDTGALRYSMSACTLTVPELVRVGRFAFGIISALERREPLFAQGRDTGPVAGNPSAELVPRRWGLGLGDFGPVAGHTGSYVASTAALYLDLTSRTVVVCALNVWDPEVRQQLAHDLLADAGRERPAPCDRRIDTSFTVGDLAGEHMPLMYGLGSVTIAPDGEVSGAMFGKITEVEGGLALATRDPILTLGVERHPQTGDPVLRLASSLCVRV